MGYVVAGVRTWHSTPLFSSAFVNLWINAPAASFLLAGKEVVR